MRKVRSVAGDSVNLLLYRSVVGRQAEERCGHSFYLAEHGPVCRRASV